MYKRQLENGTPIETEGLGNLAFRIIDTLMIVSTDADKEKWWIYSLPDLKVKTKLFNVGPGPMEFIHIPICDHVAVSHRDGHIKAAVHNAIRGRYFDVDLSESIRQNQMVARDCPCLLYTSVWSLYERPCTRMSSVGPLP